MGAKTFLAQSISSARFRYSYLTHGHAIILLWKRRVGCLDQTVQMCSLDVCDVCLFLPMHWVVCGPWHFLVMLTCGSLVHIAYTHARVFVLRIRVSCAFPPQFNALSITSRDLLFVICVENTVRITCVFNACSMRT